MTGVPPGYEQTVPPRWPGAPPTAEYLAERERLGFPSRALELSRSCRWCGASPYTECTVAATGKRMTRVHDSRTVPVLEDLAVSQP
jgi:hypothetical protein